MVITNSGETNDEDYLIMSEKGIRISGPVPSNIICYGKETETPQESYDSETTITMKCAKGTFEIGEYVGPAPSDSADSTLVLLVALISAAVVFASVVIVAFMH